jgi:hypothetical protein
MIHSSEEDDYDYNPSRMNESLLSEAISEELSNNSGRRKLVSTLITGDYIYIKIFKISADFI